MTELKIKCPDCNNGSIQGMDCPTCEGRCSILAEILREDDVLKLHYNSRATPKEYVLSQVQEIIDFNRKEVLNVISDLSCHKAPNVCECCNKLNQLLKRLEK